MEADKQLISEEEGVKQQPYYDNTPEKFVTGGIGCLLDPRKPCPLPMDVVQLLYQHRLDEKRAQASTVPGFDALNDVQRAVIVSMVYQMGFEPFDGDGHRDFTNMLLALKARDVHAAANHGRDSKWAKIDTPQRAERQMRMLETGVWVPWAATRK